MSITRGEVVAYYNPVLTRCPTRSQGRRSARQRPRHGSLGILCRATRRHDECT